MPFLLWLMLAMNLSMVTATVPRSPPVLIWGYETPETRTIFRPVSTDQFAKLLRYILKDHMIVVYLASELTAKDINCASCFNYMRFVQPMNFYTQVDEPFEALQQVSNETKGITWHNPNIKDTQELEAEMRLPCEKGRIHCFSFNDRILQAHDNAMAVSYYQFTECPAVHIYTAYTEENEAYQRRKSVILKLHTKLRTQELLQTAGKNQNLTVWTNETSFAINDDVNDGMLHHISISESSNLTILRHESAIFAFSHIILAVKQSPGKLANFRRTFVSLNHSDHSMQLGMYNDLDTKAGLVLVLDTNVCPLVIELLPVLGNWYLTRAFCEDRIFYPRDLIFFSSDFSLCCSDVSLYAMDYSRLSVFGFHLDIITSPKENGMDENYETKPCWTCSQFLSSTLAQSLIVMLFFLLVLWIGLSFITSIGRNKYVEVEGEPDLQIKTDQ